MVVDAPGCRPVRVEIESAHWAPPPYLGTMHAWVNREFLASRAREARLFIPYHALPYDRRLVPQAIELRKNMTEAERILWYAALRDARPRFLRQRPIDHFIVDFYCSTAGLVVEVDGVQHIDEEARAYDQSRTQILEGYGLCVIRLTNRMVLNDLAGTLASIAAVLHARLSDPTT